MSMNITFKKLKIIISRKHRLWQRVPKNRRSREETLLDRFFGRFRYVNSQRMTFRGKPCSTAESFQGENEPEMRVHLSSGHGNTCKRDKGRQLIFDEKVSQAYWLGFHQWRCKLDFVRDLED